MNTCEQVLNSFGMNTCRPCTRVCAGERFRMCTDRKMAQNDPHHYWPIAMWPIWVQSRGTKAAGQVSWCGIQDKNCLPEIVCGRKKLGRDDLRCRSDRLVQKSATDMPFRLSWAAQLSVKTTRNDHNIRWTHTAEQPRKTPEESIKMQANNY